MKHDILAPERDQQQSNSGDNDQVDIGVGHDPSTTEEAQNG